MHSKQKIILTISTSKTKTKFAYVSTRLEHLVETKANFVFVFEVGIVRIIFRFE